MSDTSDRYALAPLFGENRDEFVAHVPHCGHLGMRCLEVGPRFATLAIPYRDDLVGDPIRGVVFGGVITTLLDQAGGIATLAALPELASIATLDLRVDYLRAAEPGCDLVGRAECFKTTRSVAFVRGIAYDRSADDPFATCIATFMLGSDPAPHPLMERLKGGPA